MNELSVLFQNKRTLLGMALLGVLVFTTYNIQENSAKIKKISNFESGMQTCFSRVNQTYTAKLLEDATSQYLTQNFQGLTEECFAESLMSIDENFKIELASSLKKLRTLASNVHWFHEDLIAPQGVVSLSNGEGRDIGSRFEKIENTKDEVLDDSEVFKNSVSKELNSGKNIFYVTSTLLVVLMVLEYLSNTKRKISNNAREIEASIELQDNGGIQSVKLGEIVRVALEQNDLNNCAKLFNNYYINSTFEKTIRTKGKNALDNLMVPNTIATTETIDKIWNDDSIGVVADVGAHKMITEVGLNLDNNCSKVIDLLAEKLFSKGIQIDINVDEKIAVKGNEEVLEQVLYHALAFSINTTENTTQSKNVTLNAIKLGDIVAIDIINTGTGFSSEMLKNKNGIDSLSSEADLDLKICQSLITEMNGRLQIDNRIGQTGNVTGSRLKLILKSAENTTKKLIDLKKGSKQVILAQISNANN
jgi:hypothetical protein